MAGRPKAITSLADSPAEGKKNWLCYADSGVGKTVLGGTSNGLIISAEPAATESAKAFGSTADEWQVDTWEELREAYDYLKGGGYNDYDWAVIDSITEMEQHCFEYTLRLAHEANSNRSLDIPAVQDYQTVYIREQKLIDAFCRLPINVLFLAQLMLLDRTNEDDEEYQEALPLIGSTKNGVVARKVCGKVTLVGLLSVQKRKKSDEDPDPQPFRRMWTEKSKQFFAKDRHDTFGRYVDSPNILEMSEAVDERVAKAGAKASKTTAAKKTAARKSE